MGEFDATQDIELQEAIHSRYLRISISDIVIMQGVDADAILGIGKYERPQHLYYSFIHVFLELNWVSALGLDLS